MGDNLHTCNGAQEFLQHFRKKVARERIPLSGSIDLTNRCNLRCIHCYLDSQGIKKQAIQEEMSTPQILSLLDEITSAGCLYLLITGGEPLLRRDFPQIYRRAKENGLLVTVFTNGTLISKKILDLFEDLPPRSIEISIYGATKDTYENITGVEGSYDRCMNGIEQVLDRHLNLKLKTILMSVNQYEFYDMEEIARGYDIPFRFDAAIFPRFNGDRSPMDLRVSAEEAVEKEFSEPERGLEWKEFYDHFKQFPSSNHLYECGAGLTYFHINAYGNLQPCLMTREYQHSIVGGKFLSTWQSGFPTMRNIKLSPDQTCYDCPKRNLCGYCPPFFALENASSTAISDFLCSMGQLRYDKLQSLPDRRDI
jgi:radical SAM protein with 4Fe4S-binding SPASM domain